MSRSWILRGLVAAVLLQLGILATEYVNSVYPLWTGQEVRLKTIPVDPRSLFRGNYARLNYDISNITLPEKKDTPSPRQGEIVYVKLKQDENGLHVFDSASLSKPDVGLYIRGRIQNPPWNRQESSYRVRYGIEAFFAPKGKALALEKDLRSGGIAVIMIADSGKAALKEVIPDTRQEIPERGEEPSNIERQGRVQPRSQRPTPEEIHIRQELGFLSYAQEALARDDPESAYRLIEDGLVSKYKDVREKAREFIEQHPETLEGAKQSFTFKSFKESIYSYGKDAGEIEEQRLLIYKSVASTQDYEKARQNFENVFGSKKQEEK